MRPFRLQHLLALLCATALPLAPAAAHENPKVETSAFSAPNPVRITPLLLTAGQPDAAQLGKLKELGVDAVIYLAPPTVGDAVRDEQLIVTKQGALFINLPVDFNQPRDADFDAFAALLQGLQKNRRNVLVHCQVNFRASSFTFLYRSIVLKEDPQQAQEAINQVWKPNAVWRKFIEAQLQRHGLAYQLM
ncbi:protein tyrosine phosphatase family protein [Massilia sp. W12]|uniref:protein tyrosine phosphatase family protein n=1 Tax=Massilia sp. W12 TaxID=3126507 RepID=UPI0030D4B75E